MHKRVRIKVPVHSLVHLFAGVGEVTQKSVVFSWIERTENEISINYLGDDGSKRRPLHEEGRSSLMFESLHASVTVVRHLM